MLNDLKREVEKRILDRLLPQDFYFSRQGTCPCCDRPTEFLAYHPWLRDHFKCVRCGSIPRERALLFVLQSNFPNWSGLDIHESSPSRRGASVRLQKECRGYVATQFFVGRQPGQSYDGYRNENLQDMTFADKSFDVVVTQDVMEHVYDPAAVFREVARTLRPGGAHVFTVPLVNKNRASEVWASRNPDGTPAFLHEPDFHGNPIDPKGSPVTMHWGYDIVDHIRDATGLETTIESIDDLALGIRAEYNEVLVTRKPRPRGDAPALAPT